MKKPLSLTSLYNIILIINLENCLLKVYNDLKLILNIKDYLTKILIRFPL